MNTTVRSLVAAAALAAAFATAPAFADEAPASDVTVTGSAAILSQYRFRGLSQSDNLPVGQASITVSHASGFYVGTWASSAENKTSPIFIGGSEIDVFGGYTKSFDGLTLDGGVYGYIYPGVPAANYYEVYGSVAKTYGPAKAKLGVNFAPAQKVFNYNFTTATRNNTYVFGELSSGVPSTPLTVHGHVGYTMGGFDFGRQYLDYAAGVSYSWKALTLDASVVGTDLSHRSLAGTFGPVGSFGNAQAFRQAKTVGVVSLTAAF